MRKFNLCFPKKRDKPTGAKKYHWIQIGTAFEGDDGRVEIRVDAVPFGVLADVWKGESCRLVAFPRKEARDAE